MLKLILFTLIAILHSLPKPYSFSPSSQIEIALDLALNYNDIHV